MKPSAFSTTVFFLFVSFVTCHAQQVISDEQAMRSLRHFYVSYIKEKSKASKDGYRKIDSLLRRYSTPRLTEQLKGQVEEDYDFILNAQGADTRWLNSLKVAKTKTENVYEVSWVIEDSFGKIYEVKKIRLLLIRTQTDILIDGIM